MMWVIRAVVFDVGETLVDESREYGTWADWLGIPRHTFLVGIRGGHSSPARRPARGRRASAEVDTAMVREWAKRHGYEIKNRGRVPADLLAEYQAAMAA